MTDFPLVVAILQELRDAGLVAVQVRDQPYRLKVLVEEGSESSAVEVWVGGGELVVTPRHPFQQLKLPLCDPGSIEEVLRVAKLHRDRCLREWRAWLRSPTP